MSPIAPIGLMKSLLIRCYLLSQTKTFRIFWRMLPLLVALGQIHAAENAPKSILKKTSSTKAPIDFSRLHKEGSSSKISFKEFHNPKAISFSSRVKKVNYDAEDPPHQKKKDIEIIPFAPKERNYKFVPFKFSRKSHNPKSYSSPLGPFGQFFFYILLPVLGILFLHFLLKQVKKLPFFKKKRKRSLRSRGKKQKRYKKRKLEEV